MAPHSDGGATMIQIGLNSMNRTILIVEDSGQCRKILEMTFAGISGVLIEAVETAEDALRELRSGKVCALVTDLRLPQMSGFDLIEFVRSEDGFAKLPVLVVSGERSQDTQARVMALGADSFFAKPFYPSAVRGELLRLIGNPEAQSAGTSAGQS